MDQYRITNYAIRAAAIAVFLWFGFQGVQRAIVDHVMALQRARQLHAQVTRLQKELQTAKLREMAKKLAPPAIQP